MPHDGTFNTATTGLTVIDDGAVRGVIADTRTDTGRAFVRSQLDGLCAGASSLTAAQRESARVSAALRLAKGNPDAALSLMLSGAV